MSLEGIETLIVPASIVRQTERGLRRAARDGYEVFVLWSGTDEGTAFRVRNAHLPRQSSYKTRTGLLVRVDGEALHRLNTWLYAHEEILVAQVHAHPTDAFHSDTDDAYPIVTSLGGFSIVAPDFARDGLFTHETAAYRLTETGWAAVSAGQVIEVA